MGSSGVHSPVTLLKIWIGFKGVAEARVLAPCTGTEGVKGVVEARVLALRGLKAF